MRLNDCVSKRRQSPTDHLCRESVKEIKVCDARIWAGSTVLKERRPSEFQTCPVSVKTCSPAILTKKC